MKDQEILINAPYGNYKSVRMLSKKPAVWVPETYRLLDDIKELVTLRKENKDFRFKFAMTEISLKTRTTHLTSCEAALESRDELNATLNAKIAELKESIDAVCVAVFDNRGKAVTEHTLSITRKATTQFNLPLKVSK
jgi:dTDP-4-amino-4,6-dideoxygalactose transaminase